MRSHLRTWGTLLLVFWVSSSVLVTKAAPPGSQCPWDNMDLKPWSDPTTWDSGDVPKEMEKVVIPNGRRVILDVSPPSLATLTIQNGASLVWGNVEGLTLRTHYILLYGEFHIGSESCRFEKKAYVKLIGKSNTDHRIDEAEFGTKAIIVTTGGVLELHGKRKTPWTKLAQTIPSGSSVPCGFVYNHADRQKNIFAEERQAGLHVIIWDEGGTVFDFQVFKDYMGFAGFFQTVPDGKIIAILAFGIDGLIEKRSTRRSVQEVTSVVVGLGGFKIANVEKGDSYAFIARKGSPQTAQEYHKKSGQDPRYADPVAFLHLRDDQRSLDFQVAASSNVAFELFRIQRTEVAYPILTLADEVTGWEAGDQLVVASTDFDWQQAEVRTIIPCPSCSARQVRVDDSFNYLHYGNFTYNVDERAEVGILTRNIVIEGVTEAACYAYNTLEENLCARFNQDTFGGQVRVVKGFVAAHLEGVELFHMGQQNRLGGYPLHFHMCDESPGQWFRDNSIHHSFSRCVTVHGTHEVEVSGIVCYDFIGHGFFIEDGVEQNNVLNRNLGIGARHGTLLMSDMTKEWCQKDLGAAVTKSCDELSVFWITHPNNVFTNNVAAGGEGHGYMFVFPDRPLGLSYDRQVLELARPHNPRFFPIKKFELNSGHSNARFGLFFDSKISTGRLVEIEDGIPMNGILQTQNLYDPRVPPNENGQRVWTEMRRCTFYKNKENMWIKGGNLRIAYASMADAPEGLGGGTTGTETGTEVSNSIFIGETDNTGVSKIVSVSGVDNKVYNGVYFAFSFTGSPTDSLTAISTYQGPNFLKNCYFDRYRTKTWCVTDACTEKLTRYAGAVSWKRDNTYPTMTSSYVQDLKFGFCDGVYGQHWVLHGNSSTPSWVESDGNLGAFVRDKDGSLTGAPNTALVRNFPFYKGNECVDRPDWGMSVCPYKYVKMEILGDGGSLSRTLQDRAPLIMRRDDPPYNEPLIIQGTIRNEYLLRTQRSFLLDFNANLEGAQFPNSFTIYGYGVEKGDVVRIGICQPKNVETFEVRSDYPAYIRNDAVWADSIAAVDADELGNVFFYDRKEGILYFKLMSHHLRTNDSQQCPSGMCYKVTFTPVGGDRTIRSCKASQPTPFVDKTPVPPKPPGRSCTKPDSPEGLGAVIWSEVPYVSQQEFSVPCIAPNVIVAAPQFVGCYDDKLQGGMKNSDEVELASSMTVKWCNNRCFKRGYKYFAVSRSKRCNCGNAMDTTLPMKDCNKECSGNIKEMCGGRTSMAISLAGRE